MINIYEWEYIVVKVDVGAAKIVGMAMGCLRHNTLSRTYITSLLRNVVWLMMPRDSSVQQKCIWTPLYISFIVILRTTEFVVYFIWWEYTSDFRHSTTFHYTTFRGGLWIQVNMSHVPESRKAHDCRKQTLTSFAAR